MVYGTNLRLPGEFFMEPSSELDPETSVGKLQSYMNNLIPIKTQHPTNQKIFLHKNLKSSSHVFVRIDRVKKSLEPAYEGLFPVLTRQEKYFTVTIKGKNVNISIDRLKPAYMLKADSDNLLDASSKNSKTSESANAQTSQAQQEDNKHTTRCVRKVRTPVRFQE
ncbi:hypothetical protein AVEN_104464-1 [Araneus ventricosus]|uniref:Uncharacterized protein n=1 Tax=Araneus ventricosus TaxID=182803 RepID=A0A4Y2WM10_ARAVE|nr:hypothetical protein AVEN_104464-1 [Araneus ventricosus]